MFPTSTIPVVLQQGYMTVSQLLLVSLTYLEGAADEVQGILFVAILHTTWEARARQCLAYAPPPVFRVTSGAPKPSPRTKLLPNPAAHPNLGVEVTLALKPKWVRSYIGIDAHVDEKLPRH